MGEVHLAKDTRLDRKVAIKLLLAGKADRGVSPERFQSEAKAVSSLNHPNICALYDIGEQNGRDYLVMELLEGETHCPPPHAGSAISRIRFSAMPSR